MKTFVKTLLTMATGFIVAYFAGKLVIIFVVWALNGG